MDIINTNEKLSEKISFKVGGQVGVLASVNKDWSVGGSAGVSLSVKTMYENTYVQMTYKVCSPLKTHRKSPAPETYHQPYRDSFMVILIIMTTLYFCILNTRAR